MSRPWERATAASEENIFPRWGVQHNADDTTRRTEDVREYRLREGAIREQFGVDLAKEYLDPEMSKRVTDAVFHKAWDDAHSSGYRSVEDYYEDLAELVTAVYEEGIAAERRRLTHMAEAGR